MRSWIGDPKTRSALSARLSAVADERTPEPLASFATRGLSVWRRVRVSLDLGAEPRYGRLLRGFTSGARPNSRKPRFQNTEGF
jgi:hypothetical protein